jgi:P-type conjugative transfer protein TrbJ
MARYIRKIKILLCLSCVFFTLQSRPVHAVIGFGDTVFDSQNYIQQLLNYVVLLAQYYTQYQQYSQQIQQLENDYRNLQNLNFRIDLSGLNDMRQVMNEATGLSNDFASMQTQFETLYPDFNTYRTQSSLSFAQQAAKWNKINQQNSFDILKTETKVQESMYRDQDTLRYLSDRSDSASGTKDLLQVLNQLLVLQTKQLMQLEQLLSTTAKADAAYLAEKASRDAAESSRYQQVIDTWDIRNNAVVNPNLGVLH